MYKLNDEQAIIVTTDFFAPVVDDAYDFGAIAAANALSDVYAMGGQPLLAINLVAYPDGTISMDLLTEILRGGAEMVREAGAVIAGGHTVTDKEPKYGLAVIGLAHPDAIINKGGALPGDKLVLTKPLGIGVVTTALKQSKTTDDEIAAATASMLKLNKTAAAAAREFGAHALTDITGYGLVGHALEMARASQVDFHFDTNRLEWVPGALKYAEQDVFPGGMWMNYEFFSPHVTFAPVVSEPVQYLLFDPETSGGLLIAVAADKADALAASLQAQDVAARVIGEVSAGSGQMHFA